MKLKLKTALQSNPYDPKKGNESAYARYLRYVVDGFYEKSNEEVKNIWRKESRKMIREYIYFVDDNPNGTSGMTKEEIIRCKECKHYQFADNRAFGMPVKMCKWFKFEDVDDDDFCSRAERKEQ